MFPVILLAPINYRRELLCKVLHFLGDGREAHLCSQSNYKLLYVVCVALRHSRRMPNTKHVTDKTMVLHMSNCKLKNFKNADINSLTV